MREHGVWVGPTLFDRNGPYGLRKRSRDRRKSETGKVGRVEVGKGSGGRRVKTGIERGLTFFGSPLIFVGSQEPSYTGGYPTQNFK